MVAAAAEHHRVVVVVAVVGAAVPPKKVRSRERAEGYDRPEEGISAAKSMTRVAVVPDVPNSHHHTPNDSDVDYPVV